jgi:hypothetical protein
VHHSHFNGDGEEGGTKDARQHDANAAEAHDQLHEERLATKHGPKGKGVPALWVVVVVVVMGGHTVGRGKR